MASVLASRFLVLTFAGSLLLSLAGCGPEYPSCDQDEDCHEAEYCVNGTCQQCRGDADCPAGQSCASGRCEAIDGYCDAAHACPDGQECVENRCRAATATDASCAAVTCPVGSRCENGTCVDETPAAPVCTLEPIYFEYDSDSLDEADRRGLQAASRCIGQLRPGNVHATGHADERGTEEYNLALSERRAQAVVRYLRGLGVALDMSASGMGEEMATGADEAGWLRDRRVDLHPR